MSYTIALFDYKLPEDFYEASIIFDAADHDSTIEIKPIFQKFHDEITQIFPCICDLDDDDGEIGVWSDGPLINNFRREVPVIGLTLNHVGDALQIVIETANDLGISVLDWQSGTVFN